MQVKVVTADLLREAKASPAAHRDLIVRVAGYRDDFCALSEALRDEIIRRTEHAAFQGRDRRPRLRVVGRWPWVAGTAPI